MEFCNHYHQYNNPTFSYDHPTIVAMDPLPPPDKEEQEIVNMYVAAKKESESFHRGGVVYFFRKEAETDSVIVQEDEDASTCETKNQDPNKNGTNVGSWKSWAASSTESWLQYIRSKLKGMFWILQPLVGQRWVVEVSTQYVNRKGEKVTDTTEFEFLSKEIAESYARRWTNVNKQVCMGGSRAPPYNIKIFTKTYGQPTPAEAAIAAAMQDPEHVIINDESRGD